MYQNKQVSSGAIADGKIHIHWTRSYGVFSSLHGGSFVEDCDCVEALGGDGGLVDGDGISTPLACGSGSEINGTFGISFWLLVAVTKKTQCQFPLSYNEGVCLWANY